MNNKQILSRLYNDYTKKFLKKIFIAAFFSIFVAGSTSSIAWLLDPAIKKIFIEKDQTLILIIPLLIIIAFTTKGVSLYLAKTIMIGVGEEVKKILQSDMLKSFIEADTQFIEDKHTGKYISNLTFDVSKITNLLTNALLSLFKDSLTLIGLLVVMFYQNWKLSLVALIMIPLASIMARTLGKRIGKVVTEAQEKSGFESAKRRQQYPYKKLHRCKARERAIGHKMEALNCRNASNTYQNVSRSVFFRRLRPGERQRQRRGQSGMGVAQREAAFVQIRRARDHRKPQPEAAGVAGT